jgi:pimeloyl-ACP methyl ester carboxylesterase
MKQIDLYQQPMDPWIELQGYENSITIFDGDLTLFYYELGAANPHTMLLIHGLGDEADTWRHILKPLGEQYHIIALDLPGFGRSGLPENKITPPLLLNCLLEILKAKKIETTILVGSSLGGILAHAFGLKYTKKVEGMVLIGGTLFQIDTMGDFSLRLMQIPLLGEWLYKRLRKDPQAAYDSLRNVYLDLNEMPQADREFLFTRVNNRVWSDKQCQAYFSTLRNLSPWIKSQQEECLDQLENLTIPTLVLRGEHDSLFSKKNAIGVKKVQPNTTFAEIADSGHLPHQEAPEEFLSLLGQWLKRNFN